MATEIASPPLLAGQDVHPLREIWRSPGTLTWAAALGSGGPRLVVRTLTRTIARAPGAARAFRLRQREVARLGHAAIPGPLAVGMVDEVLSARSGGHLPEGAPAVALPWTPGDRCSAARTWGWSALRALLDETLAALAHAHARGVLHLDLRPSAMLLRRGGGVALVDFGVAVPDRDGVRRAAADVGLAAPELMDADWTRIGPWTDLYALAATAWILATGSGAFTAPNRRAIRFRQLQGEPVAFQPRAPMPAGLAGLLRGLLHPDPTHRLGSAAAARHALAQLGGEPGAVGLDEPTAAAARAAGVPIRRVADTPAALPPSPAGSLRPALSLPLGRLRDTPTIGRPTEQAALWAALDETERQGRARVVLLQGPPGSGRRHLARWLGLRVQEEDLVDAVLDAHHDDAHEGGLAPAVRRCLRLDRASTPGFEASARRAIGALRLPWEGLDDALVAWLTPAAVAPGWPETGLLHGLLHGLSRGRPVVLLVQDLRRSAATMRAISALLRRQHLSPVPVLVVATATPGEVPELPAPRPGSPVVSVRVGPIPTTDVAGIPAHIAPVGRRAARTLHTHTGGLPLDLRLATWIGTPTATRYDRDAAWAHRLRGAVRGETERALLARAAVLGRHVDRAELEAAWPAPLPQDLAERLEDAGLGIRTRSGWRFAHASLHRHILEQAADLPVHHMACADALERMDAASWGPAHAVRIARHRLRAGDRTAGWRDAIAAADAAESQGRTAILVEALDVAAGALPAGTRGRRRIELGLRRALAQAELAGATPSLAIVQRAVDDADAVGATDLALRGAIAFVRAGGPASVVGLPARLQGAAALQGLSEGLLVLAEAHEADERPGAAYAAAERALALPPDRITPAGRARADALCARLLLQQGDRVEAGARARSLLRAPREQTGAAPRAVARRVLAQVAAAHARPAEALRQWRACRAEAQRLDDDRALAAADARIARMLHAAGELDAARAHAQQVLGRGPDAIPAALVLRLAALAGAWRAWDTAWMRLGALRETGAADLTAAADLARAAGQSARAADAEGRLP